MVDELEKRKFKRLQYPLDVAIEIAASANVRPELPPVRVQSRNISMGGICLETTSMEIHGVNVFSGRPFARDSRLRLSITLFPKEPPFEATGEVRWYDIARDIPGSIYRLGVAFMEMHADGREQLERFLKD